MASQLGTVAPDFEAETTMGHVKFHEWIGSSWVVFFSHPKDFTPVCTTELGVVANLKAEFDKRNCKRIAVSVDDVPSHKGWIGDIEDTQKAKMDYPILADPDRKVSTLYGMIHPQANDTLTVRSVFFIDPKKKIRAMITYPASTGRNFAEMSWRRRCGRRWPTCRGNSPTPSACTTSRGTATARWPRHWACPKARSVCCCTAPAPSSASRSQRMMRARNSR